jgi:predicted TPR repeat methyltransferase
MMPAVEDPSGNRADQSPPDRAAISEAMRCLAEGDGEAAELVLERLRREAATDGDVLNLSGIAAHLLGRTEDAVQLTAAAVATDPESGLFHANHGAALAAAGRPALALAALEQSLRFRPQDARTQRNFGLALAQLGRTGQALPALYRARDLAPDDPETFIALARCLRESGAREAAADCARQALLLSPEPMLAEEARFLLAGVGSDAPMPAQAPASYVRGLFDAYAPVFDQHLTQELGYRTPEAIAAALAEAGLARDRRAEILDLGCGTGLSGVALAPFAAAITGVDLSPKMLERAAATGAYARLIEAELPACLADFGSGAFDVAAAADVLIYLGEPAPVLAAVARVLRPGGLFALSLELAPPGCAIEVSDALRYRHDAESFLADSSAAGFTPLVRQESDIRLNRGKPVPGLLLVLARSAAVA